MPIRPKIVPRGGKPLRGADSRTGRSVDGEVHGDSGDKPATRRRGKGKGSKAKKRPPTKPASAVPADDGGIAVPASAKRPAEPNWYAQGFTDDEWQDAGVRGRVFVCGLPGSGKSQLLVDRIRTGRRVVVYNPVNAKTLLQLQGDGFVNVSQPSQLRALLAQQWGLDFRILYTPMGGVQADHFEAVNKLVAKCGKMVYAIDEVDKHQEPGWCPPNFYDLVNYCRHYEVAMIGTARRPAQVSKEYTYGLSEVVGFNITEPGDLKYFASKCGEQAVRTLPKLGQYAYLRWMQDGRISTGKGWS